MSRITVTETPLSGLYVLHRTQIGDSRGSLERMFCQAELQPLLKTRAIRQINRTMTSHKGIIRGMHFQRPPSAELKIVTCTRGSVFDVAIDLRRDSLTFMEHYSITLSGESMQSLLIPEGFAHGFQSLETDCEMFYLHTADYDRGSEGGLNALDPQLNIPWPLKCTARSTKDMEHALLNSNYDGLDCR